MGSSPADMELIAGCRQNDRQAQEKLYKQFYGPMISICLRYTKNQDDAIEVLHNGFLKVYKHIHTFEPAKASLYTWIRTIIVHSAIDYIRHRDRFYPAVQMEQAEEPSIDSDAVSRLSANELLAVIKRLPPATQAVFNLYIIEGYTHKDIASMLNISEGTSKWHLSHARKQLQQLLTPLQL